MSDLKPSRVDFRPCSSHVLSKATFALPLLITLSKVIYIFAICGIALTLRKGLLSDFHETPLEVKRF